MKSKPFLFLACTTIFFWVPTAFSQVPQFLTPELIVTPGATWAPAVTGDGLEMYYTDWNDDQWELSRITRPTKESPWIDSGHDRVEELSSSVSEDEITFTSDGLRAIFSRDAQIFETTRSDLTSPWMRPERTTVVGWAPHVSNGGLTLYYTVRMWDDIGADIHVATRDSISEPFGTGQPVPGLNTPNKRESSPFVSSDGLDIYFVSDRLGGYGLEDIWTASRPSLDAPFGEAFNLGPEINSPRTDWSPFVGSDGVLYYTRDTIRGECCWDIFQALPADPLPIPFDCNGDGLLTISDLNCTPAENVSLALQELGVLPGDANGDGEVAFDDFLTLSANFGQPGSYTEGDFDGNGEIAFADFLVVSTNFGKSASTIAVPEPGGYQLFAFFAIGLLFRPRPVE